MPRIRSFRHLGVWVAFLDDDYGQTSMHSFGLTQRAAERRTLNKIPGGDF